MNVTCFLAVVLLCLVIYALIRELIINRKRGDRNKKAKEIRKLFACHDLPRIIEFLAQMVFVVLFLCLYFTHFPLMLAILSIPAIVIYSFILIITLATTWKVIISGERTQLTPLETNSLAFLGIIFAVLGLIRSTYFAEIYSEATASIMHISVLAIEYTVYIFFISSLAFLPITDCCKALKWCASKYSKMFYALRAYVRRKIVPRTIKCELSVKLARNFQTKSRWRKWLCILPMLLTFALDVLAYLIQYIFIIALWIPVFCLVESSRLICSFILRIACRLCAFSSRRITVIAFRLSIAVAMLLVVIMNRFGYITTTDATTSVLEFVASVLIIPIVLGWIQEALPDNKNTEQSHCPNCSLAKNTDKK